MILLTLGDHSSRGQPTRQTEDATNDNFAMECKRAKPSGRIQFAI